MSFLFFIFLVFLAVVLYPLFKVGRTVRNVRKNFSEAYRQQTQNARGEREGQYDPTTGRQKKYDTSEGEYVDFEEVQEPVQPTEKHQSEQFQREEQISDAEFEEIP